MAEETAVQKSLVEQIFDEMFSILAEEGVFDSETTNSLRQLSEKGSLKKPNQVEESLKTAARKTS